MKRYGILPGLLLLAGTHTAVFLLARDKGMHDQLRETSYFLPAKSADRPAMTRAGGDGSTTFTRMLRELEQSGMSRRDFELAREALFREWLHRDLHTVLDLLYGPLTADRYSHSNLRKILEKELHEEISRQPREVWGWIAGRRYGTEGRELCECWLKALMGSGQADVAMECLAQDLHFLGSGEISRLSDDAPAALLPQLRELCALKTGELPAEENMRGLKEYSWRMAEEAGRDPLPFLATEKSPELRKEFIKNWTSRELACLPTAAAVAGVLALPEDVRGDAVHELANTEREDGFRSAVEFINAVDGAGLLGDPASEDAREIASATINESYMYDAESLNDSIRDLLAIRAAPLRQVALEEMAVSCLREGAESALGYMNLIPAGPDRDVFLKRVATSWKIDPAVQEQIIAAVGDPAVVAEIRKEAKENLEHEKEEEEE